LIDNLLVPIIFVAHHLGQFKSITSLLDGIEILVPSGCHPFLIDPLGLHHMVPLRDIHRSILIDVQEAPKASISAHPLARIDRSLTILGEGAKSHLLGVLDEHVATALLGLVHLKGLRLLIIIVI
jgi:hypothetical protein